MLLNGGINHFFSINYVGPIWEILFIYEFWSTNIGKVVKSELKFPIRQFELKIEVENEAIFFNFPPIVTHVEFTS